MSIHTTVVVASQAHSHNSSEYEINYGVLVGLITLMATGIGLILWLG